MYEHTLAIDLHPSDCDIVQPFFAIFNWAALDEKDIFIFDTSQWMFLQISLKKRSHQKPGLELLHCENTYTLLAYWTSSFLPSDAVTQNSIGLCFSEAE